MAAKTNTTKTAYAMLGAPVWAAKKLVGLSTDVADAARKEVDVWSKEGEQVAKKFRGRKTMEDLSHRVDMDNIQDQVEKLRDQLEGVLSNWKVSFKPISRPTGKPAAKKTTTAARKTAAPKKTTTKKTTTAKKPAEKKEEVKAEAKESTKA